MGMGLGCGIISWHIDSKVALLGINMNIYLNGIVHPYNEKWVISWLSTPSHDGSLELQHTNFGGNQIMKTF